MTYERAFRASTAMLPSGSNLTYESPRDSQRLAAVRVLGMRTGIVVDVKAADRRRLAAIVANRNSPEKHVWRARIVLLTADGLGTAEIMRRTGKSKSVVWRWQERFMQAGVDGLLRDKRGAHGLTTGGPAAVGVRFPRSPPRVPRGPSGARGRAPGVTWPASSALDAMTCVPSL